ncbi:hypothetical protein AOLI_G00077850 [Acnodon oligacanthus]
MTPATQFAVERGGLGVDSGVKEKPVAGRQICGCHGEFEQSSWANHPRHVGQSGSRASERYVCTLEVAALQQESTEECRAGVLKSQILETVAQKKDFGAFIFKGSVPKAVKQAPSLFPLSSLPSVHTLPCNEEAPDWTDHSMPLRPEGRHCNAEPAPPSRVCGRTGSPAAAHISTSLSFILDRDERRPCWPGRLSQNNGASGSPQSVTGQAC